MISQESFLMLIFVLAFFDSSFDHQDINIISFTNNGVCHYILNVYSDSSHSALKYLKDTEVNINNVLLMMDDFNIRYSLWDPSFHFILLLVTI